MIEYNDITIKELTGISLGEPRLNSYVARTASRASKKPIGELTAEEIRLLIGQRIGVKFLLHRAVLILEKDPLIETAHFEGDLMKTLLELEPEAWSENELDYSLFRSIVSLHKSELLTTMIPIELFDRYGRLKE